MVKDVFDVLLDEIYTITKQPVSDAKARKIEKAFIRKQGHFLIDTDSVVEMDLLHNLIRKHFNKMV